MAGFFESNFFQELGNFANDTADSISGGANKELYQQQLDQQAQTNAQIFALEQERIAHLQSPEYRKQQTLKLVVVAVMFMGVVFLAYKLLAK